MTFEQLYESHKGIVFNLALQYAQNMEDAEEITQDVFVSVYQSIDQFKEQSSISTWIYRICINKSLDHIKAKKRKKRFGIFTSLFYEDSSDLRYDLPNVDHPGIQLEQKERLTYVFSCINQLPDKQKTALILSKIERKSQVEIAAIMNISPKAVESLVQRAKTGVLKKMNLNE